MTNFKPLAIALSLSLASLTTACVEAPADDDVADEDQDKDGGGSMQLRDEAVSASFQCDEWFSCDIDIRAKRCESGRHVNRVLGELTLTNQKGEVVVKTDVTDESYVWLIGTANTPGAYRNIIPQLAKKERFTLSFVPATLEAPEPPAEQDPDVPPSPFPAPQVPEPCINLAIKWF